MPKSKEVTKSKRVSPAQKSEPTPENIRYRGNWQAVLAQQNAQHEHLQQMK